MKTSKQGLDLIKFYEGFKSEAYKCPAGIWTIGYGHTGNVNPDDKVSEEYATELLKKDVEVAERAVNSYITSQINQNQFDALVSFTFNLGAGNLKTSTLLKTVNSDPNNFDEIKAQFLRWNKAGGKVMEGLTKRREAESDMYIKGSN